MKSRFEEMGGTYTEIDGIFYPNLALPEPELRPIGKWGMMHEIYLREHKPFTYINLLTTCKLDSYLADINGGSAAAAVLPGKTAAVCGAKSLRVPAKRTPPHLWRGHCQGAAATFCCAAALLVHCINGNRVLPLEPWPLAHCHCGRLGHETLSEILCHSS